MYDPPAFREERLDVLHDLMRTHALAALVTFQEGRLTSDHLPLCLHTQPGTRGMLRGHIARANPMWRAVEAGSEVLAVFQGPQAYVTPSWYPSKQEHGKVVPTWNYVIVQARGAVTFHTGDAWLYAHLEDLTDRQEGTRQVPWKVADAPADFMDRQMKGIVGLEIAITGLDGKWKVSQNRAAVDQAGVVEGLRLEDREEAYAVANLVSERS